MNRSNQKSSTHSAKQTAGHELKDFIANRPFFSGLTDQHQQALIDCAILQEFAEGESLFCEGDPANRFYLMVEGEVALESAARDEQPVLIQIIGAGEVLGWSWLFPPYYWHFTARATKPTKAIFFYGTPLRQLCDEDPKLGYELLKRITGVVVQRLQATRHELLEMAHRLR